jgi:DNA-binding transcriptional LysR family regulator
VHDVQRRAQAATCWVRLRLLSELTGELFNRRLAGELDVAAVLLPVGRTAPPPLLTNIIATDRAEIVQGAAGNVDGDWKSLGRAPWVLNPPGWLLRANLIDQMGRAGFTPMIAAEIHNMHLQLAFVQSGYGVGLLPARFIARNNSLETLKYLRPQSFDLCFTRCEQPESAHISVILWAVQLRLGPNLKAARHLLTHVSCSYFLAVGGNTPFRRRYIAASA